MSLTTPNRADIIKGFFEQNAKNLISLEVQETYLKQEYKRLEPKALFDQKMNGVLPQIKEALNRVASQLEEVKAHQKILTELYEKEKGQQLEPGVIIS